MIIRLQYFFCAGPCPAKPTRMAGSIAPTTIMRIDSSVEIALPDGDDWEGRPIRFRTGPVPKNMRAYIPDRRNQKI